MTTMPPIADANRYVSYTVSTSTTNFAFPFPLFGQSDLKVYYNGTLLTYGTDYTVTSSLYGQWTLAPNPVTDSVVVLNVGVSSGTIEIYGSIRPSRTVQATSPFSTFNFNYAFSYLAASLRELYHQFTRALQVPGGESSVIIPSIASRAGNVLAFDTSGNPVAVTPSTGGVVGTSNIIDGSVTTAKLSSTVQSSIAGAMPYAGGTFTGAVTLSGNPSAALQAAPKQYVDAASPAGKVSYFAQNTAPNGWIKANGAAISRTTYATLFAAIGTTFGAGDGSTTFNVPDLRGEFVRGWDDARGVDSGRAFGSAQSDLVKDHTHNLSQNLNATNFAPAAGSGVGGNAGGSFPTGNMSSGGGTETRPRNVALLACIKY